MSLQIIKEILDNTFQNIEKYRAEKRVI